MTRFLASAAVRDRLFIQKGKPGPDRRAWIVRPDDLVALAVDLVNLKVVPVSGASGDGASATLARIGPGACYLVVTFPPQHLTEIAYFTTVPEYPLPSDDPDAVANSSDETPQPPPIEATIAGWSRLVFRVHDADLPIEWTIAGLLEAMGRLTLSVAPNALPPAPPKVAVASVADLGLVVASAASGVLDATAAAQALPVDIVSARPPMSVVSLMGQARIQRKLRLGAVARGEAELTPARIAETRALATTPNAAGAVVDIQPNLGYELAAIKPWPKPPGAMHTSLEVPYRLILSPSRRGAWFHATKPVRSEATGHIELWHTRLGTRFDDGTRVDGPHRERVLRAIWSPDLPPSGALNVPTHVNFPWRMSLDSFDRVNVVHLSSDFSLPKATNPKLHYQPKPLDVDLFTLSSLGAWLDSRGAWDERPMGLSVEEWRHRATLGRDHYVRVVYAGFLFPFGHRASVIKVTERRFHDTGGDPPGKQAYLRQLMYLVVREPLRTFRNSNRRYDGADPDRHDEQLDLLMPFESVRITTRVSPLLDDPEHTDIKGKSQSCFWPFVSEEPFKFHLVATDTAGNEIDLAMPLIFIGEEESQKPYAQSVVREGLDDGVLDDYATRTYPKGSTLLADVPLGGQKVALGESAAPDDTTFAVRSIIFGGDVPGQASFDGMSPLHPRYFPVLRSARLDVPSLQRIAGSSAPVGVIFTHDYLTDGFEGANVGQVFLGRDPAAPQFDVKFSSQSDRSGGFVTPDLSVSGFSRISGPIAGDLTKSTGGQLDPTSWFGALDSAKIFGVLSLSTLLKAVGFDDIAKLPQFVGQGLNQVEQLIADLDRLKRTLDIDGVPQTATAASLLDQLLHPANGSLTSLLGGGSVANAVSQLGLLQGELQGLPSAIAGVSMPAGPKALITQAATALEQAIGAVLGDVDLLNGFAGGLNLPEALNARFEWRPLIGPWGPFRLVPDTPEGRNLLLSVDASGDAPTVTCSLDNFLLDLEVVRIEFERVQFRMRAGKKPEIDVVMNDQLFAGVLAFVQTLSEILPLDGFSDPPEVTVSAEGISAGFSFGLPNLSVGVFSLENLSIAAGFSIPFIGPPMSVFFRFCERENPARLTVSLFGGGFYFGFTLNADGLQVLEGAIEFGASISIDFGVASGGVSAMAGLYFKIEGSDFTLAGYFRLRGEVEALGLISVCIELYLEMRYESASGKCVGTATLSIEVDVTLFSVTVEITCTKKFAGSGDDPTLRQALDVAPDATSADWNEYCAAFA